MSDPLLEAKARVQRHWNIDGLHEIAIAVMFLLTALCVWVGSSPAVPKFWRGAASVAFPVILIGGISAEGAIVRSVRRRLTFPRTGFVAFRKASPKIQARTSSVAFMVAILVAFAVAGNRAANMERFLVPALSLLFGGFIAWMGRCYELPRFLAVASVSVLSGIVIGVAGLSLNAGMAAYWAAMGAAMLISGAVALRHFLRTAPAPGVE